MAANPLTFPMPEKIARLNRDTRGYPIFFTIIGSEQAGNPFLGLNPTQVIAALRERLCGVCGQALGYWIYFVGGPISCHETRLFTEPPMHRCCLEYAAAVCPFIANPHYRRIEERADRPKSRIPDPAGVLLNHPEMFLYRTRRYQWQMDRTGLILIKAGPPKAVEPLNGATIVADATAAQPLRAPRRGSWRPPMEADE